MSLHMRPIRVKLGPFSSDAKSAGCGCWAVQHLVDVEENALGMAPTQLSRYQEVAWNN
jgi:hypothetical protein